MKGLAYLICGIVCLPAFSQPVQLRNANVNFAAATLNGSDFKTKLISVSTDNKGIAWFQTITEIYSFDGANWRTYKPGRSTGKYAVLFISDMLVKKDGSIFLATEDGIYVLDRGHELFIPMTEYFPEAKKFPLAVSALIIDIPGKLFFISEHNDGFYLFDLATRTLKHIIIDSALRTMVPAAEEAVTYSRNGNIWGLTRNGKGIWHYDLKSGKVSCSWKNELSGFSPSQFKDLTGIIYSEKDDALWLSNGNKGWAQKKMLHIDGDNYYSFSGDLTLHADTLSKGRYSLQSIKQDGQGNIWVLAASKYLVRINQDRNNIEYITNQSGILSLGEIQWLKTNNSVLLWTGGPEKISMIRERRNIIRHISFDTTLATGISTADFDNTNERHNLFFVNGDKGGYYIFQQDEGRPKAIRLDNDLKVRDALLNDQWKNYPAYFNSDFNKDSIYIAILRPGIEPLDFRKVVIKDFKVDLRSFSLKEMRLSFPERVWCYGLKDRNNVSWLFSGGYLYSFDQRDQQLDSIFICKPDEKKSFPLEFIKGYDYPAVLNKASATYWISFIPNKELFKIDLQTRKIARKFKCCISGDSCEIPGGVYDMYGIDEKRIFLSIPYTAMVLYPANDSLVEYNRVFGANLLTQNPGGSGLYKDWFNYVLPSRVYFLNQSTGQLKSLSLGEDYKWKPAQLNSPPVINDKGEMVLISSLRKGFLVFNTDSLVGPVTPGIVQISWLNVDNKTVSLDSLFKERSLRLRFNKYHSIQMGFSDLSLFGQRNISYDYSLFSSGDTSWTRITGKPEITLSGVSPGKYRLLFRASNPFGDYSSTISSLSLTIIPPFWRTIWFSLILVLFFVGIVYGIYRFRMKQLTRLQLIRNNIARDLHDDIGSTLNSISIYSEVAKKQAGKEIPALDLIGSNSRAIIESMSDIVWTINPENDSFEKIIVRMRSFAYQLLKAKKVEYTFEANEALHDIVLPMQVRKNFYLVFKEAITNMIKYSEASKVAISLRLENKTVVLQIRDNGKGIPVNSETNGNGLMNMKRRAEEINAQLSISSSKDEGTDIELLL